MKATYSAGHFSAAALFRETQLPTLSSTPGPSELKFSQVEPEGLEPLDGVHMALPIGSMYGIFTYIYHENQLNVGKYTIHGSYGL